MKDYKEVVANRYEKQQIMDIKNNIYSVFNGVGCKGYITQLLLLRKYISFISKELNKEPNNLKLLDIGCGTGQVIRLLAEICCNTRNIYGTELSKNRINYNKIINGNIDVKYSDLVNELPFDFLFDAIFAFDVFMHLKSKEDVINGLKNIYDKLEYNGFFCWYDCNSKSHFLSKKEVDGEGFSFSEMIELACEVGFKFVSKETRFKIIKIWKKEYHTYYLAKSLPLWVTFVLDAIIPNIFCRASNNIVIFKK